MWPAVSRVLIARLCIWPPVLGAAPPAVLGGMVPAPLALGGPVVPPSVVFPPSCPQLLAGGVGVPPRIDEVNMPPISRATCPLDSLGTCWHLLPVGDSLAVPRGEAKGPVPLETAEGDGGRSDAPPPKVWESTALCASALPRCELAVAGLLPVALSGSWWGMGRGLEGGCTISHASVGSPAPLELADVVRMSGWDPRPMPMPMPGSPPVRDMNQVTQAQV